MLPIRQSAICGQHLDSRPFLRSPYLLLDLAVSRLQYPCPSFLPCFTSIEEHNASEEPSLSCDIQGRLQLTHKLQETHSASVSTFAGIIVLTHHSKESSLVQLKASARGRELSQHYYCTTSPQYLSSLTCFEKCKQERSAP